MSGAGRKSNYRKGVTNQYLENDEIELQESDRIGRVTGNRGANIFDVVLPSGEKVLVKLPSKFHKVIWVKVKDFIIVEGYGISKDEEMLTVKHILNKDHIKALKKQDLWPNEFCEDDQADNKVKPNYMDDIMPEYQEQEEDYENAEDV